MKGRSIPYSPAELAWLETNRSMPIADYHRGFSVAFDREDVSAANLHALRKRKGWRTGRSGHFAKGQVPANKGKTMPYHPNSAATRFKPGERRGVAVKLYKPIGTERLSKEGYVERKIHDGLPLQSRWRAVHLIRWEEANGPLPAGQALKCLDGDRTNTDPNNWAEIPRALLPRLNGGRHKTRLAFDEASPELKPTILATAKLAHASRLARKGTA
ncbi:HNH endonuclease [Sphingomonas montanisoli]|uniref:HNH endonuclease n=1 Tax=Sphingomonas montanisoli TaxID=2606412 RepID=A0A5D9C5F9_9SPHN|nr:HNH endonuclease [Sphingomonas montanisoli]TZG26477.1 HNH endonuclease [Sphingomonas montanisoli]